MPQLREAYCCGRHKIRHLYSAVSKSLAIELHNDVISEVPDAKNMVVFRQFDGVAPRNYLRLFRPNSDRKRNGVLARQSRETALPIFRVPLDAKRDYEDKVIAEIAAKEQNHSLLG